MSADQNAEVEPKTEFGGGVVVCLAKFSEHIHPQALSRWEKDGITDLSMAIEMIMNAASDHFYDLDRERAPEPLIELADLTLEMGHGFTGKKWVLEDWERVRVLWRESCLAVDRMLGTDPDWGSW